VFFKKKFFLVFRFFRFLKVFKVFKGFLDFSVQRQPDKNLPSRKYILEDLDPISHSPCHYKFRLKCENKYIIYDKIGQK